jgi:hypothetical protein
VEGLARLVAALAAEEAQILVAVSVAAQDIIPAANATVTVAAASVISN